MELYGNDIIAECVSIGLWLGKYAHSQTPQATEYIQIIEGISYAFAEMPCTVRRVNNNL